MVDYRAGAGSGPRHSQASVSHVPGSTARPLEPAPADARPPTRLHRVIPMMPIAALFLCVALPQGGDSGLWRALPLPGICRGAPTPLEAPRLVHGTHLIVSEGDVDGGHGESPVPPLSSATFSALLGEEARREGWSVTVYPTSPPLLVRGPEPGLQNAAAFCAEIDSASRALDLELGVWLVRGPSTAEPQAAAPKDAPWATARLRSGDTAVLGEQLSQSYVHNYSVEVATDAGVAAPVVGRALTGDVLHLRAMRIRRGKGVFLEGFLDLSRLQSIEDFELSATDLGSVQRPKVTALQVGFSGAVDSGAPLRVAWTGLTGLGDLAEGSLWIVPKSAPEAVEGRWRLYDSALAEAAPWILPLVSPGGGLRLPDDPGGEDGAGADWAPLPSAQLAKEVESARTANTRSRPAFVGGRGVVLGPRQETDAWTAIEDLATAFESLRTRTTEILVQRQGASVRLPVTHGARWRVLFADETTAVVDYDVEIAPETWMPGPRVERRLDGFFAQGRTAERATSFVAWTAATPERRVAERSSIPLGRLELPQRTWRSARGEARAGAGATAALSGDSGLSITLRAP